MRSLFYKVVLLTLVFFQCNSVLADENTILSETVQIFSYNLTENNYVLHKSSASGTIISKEGIVLTNHHVVRKFQLRTFFNSFLSLLSKLCL